MPSADAWGATTDERPALAEVVPAEPNKPYDMRSVISELVDDQEYLEVHENWARNIVCALGRIDGEVVAVVGNQPMILAGVLDIPAAQKAARFVRFCDAFGIPLVTLVDVPGFLPGTGQEHAGIIRHGAKLTLRLLRGDRATRPDDRAQGLRWRVHRDGLSIRRRRPLLFLAH
jgi:acetyl-CoA carboxylase carboxyltransferase component